jgi:hypothetical protein
MTWWRRTKSGMKSVVQKLGRWGAHSFRYLKNPSRQRKENMEETLEPLPWRQQEHLAARAARRRGDLRITSSPLRAGGISKTETLTMAPITASVASAAFKRSVSNQRSSTLAAGATINSYRATRSLLPVFAARPRIPLRVLAFSYSDRNRFRGVMEAVLRGGLSRRGSSRAQKRSS